jgi:RNA polymerase II subunit A-like phosphatase
MQPGPSTDAGRVTTETVPTVEEWDEARTVIRTYGINWDDINNEVDAAMNESDD